MSRSFSVFLLPTQSLNYWYLLLTLIDIGQNIWKIQKQKGSGLVLGEAFSGAKLSPLKLVFGLSSLQFIPLTHFLKRKSSFGADAEYSFY